MIFMIKGFKDFFFNHVNHLILLIMVQTFHSVLKLFTGLAIAAFIAWKLIVSSAIKTAKHPAAKNTHQLILMWYAKSCSQLFIAHHATGKATRADIITSFRKSLDSIETILVTLAPKTLRMPISFTRCSAAYVARPNNPKHAMRIESIAPIKKIV